MLARESARSQRAGGVGDSATDLHDDAESELGGESGTLASPSHTMSQQGGHVSWGPLPMAAPSTPSPGKAGVNMCATCELPETAKMRKANIHTLSKESLLAQ
jgi:hypothetical protein